MSRKHLKPEARPKQVHVCPVHGCENTMRPADPCCPRCWTLLPPRTQQALSTSNAAMLWRHLKRFRELLVAGKKPEEIWL